MAAQIIPLAQYVPTPSASESTREQWVEQMLDYLDLLMDPKVNLEVLANDVANLIRSFGQAA